MPALTRGAHPERSDTWHVYYGDIHVGTIAVQSGLPLSAAQWRWDCWFYPASHRGQPRSGYASTFEQTRAGFEAAWKDYLDNNGYVDTGVTLSGVTSLSGFTYSDII
ncbi:MAG: hypothetical protein H0V72_17610 [Bradyrhizobium sp.]|nr:hypothetical protein [Bradyrhizobium sp.]